MCERNQILARMSSLVYVAVVADYEENRWVTQLLSFPEPTRTSPGRLVPYSIEPYSPISRLTYWPKQIRSNTEDGFVHTRRRQRSKKTDHNSQQLLCHLVYDFVRAYRLHGIKREHPMARVCGQLAAQYATSYPINQLSFPYKSRTGSPLSPRSRHPWASSMLP